MVEDKHTVYLVDDDASVLRSLSFMLESYDFQVREFASAEAFIAAEVWQQTGCVILDMRMPGLSGQQLHQLLRQHQSPLAVIYLTGHGDVPLAVDALKQGAVDFFQKPADGAMLAQAVTKAMQCSQANALRQQQLQTYQKLTPREREILKLIAKGYKNQQIADELFIAVRTVEIHRANLMRGMQVDSLAELMLTYAAIANTLAQSDG
ncbi:response regulator transcription factor [Shewanella fodinae]|jgi:two-component system response regulator TtrR|uniref:LuxR family two component transcriptional regulator n=1 Tax=Shewanella fodinae TaxID=552357 RepID=A0A4R2F8I8_9GAMM|nr:response regulator [Shewanella fodinae]MDN5370884.1 two-component system, LuxR family, response regulator TtrR [Shewanella sp.]TCN82791.1 LuxR family two component transcriptional regulator [Shewanella fodinae]